MCRPRVPEESRMRHLRRPCRWNALGMGGQLLNLQINNFSFHIKPCLVVYKVLILFDRVIKTIKGVNNKF